VLSARKMDATPGTTKHRTLPVIRILKSIAPFRVFHDLWPKKAGG
jgi:hypothetical protein